MRMRQELHPKRSRWTLDLLQAACFSCVRVRSRGSFKRVLTRLRISYQRARTYLHSPDAAYELKLAYLRQVIASHKEGQTAILMQDELTYYNHASPAPDHCLVREQPKAGLAIGGERSWRVVGALDIFSGQFIAQQRQRIRVPTFVAFLQQIQQKYPHIKTIYLILDNWPVHFHPDVLAALEKQHYPFPFVQPTSWKNIKPAEKYKKLNLPIQLLPLPTYASWLNPVEKIWKWLKQEILHNHSFANNFKELKELVNNFLQRIQIPSHKNLAVTGILNPKGIFADQLQLAGLQLKPSG